MDVLNNLVNNYALKSGFKSLNFKINKINFRVFLWGLLQNTCV